MQSFITEISFLATATMIVESKSLLFGCGVKFFLFFFFACKVENFAQVRPISYIINNLYANDVVIFLLKSLTGFFKIKITNTACV